MKPVLQVIAMFRDGSQESREWTLDDMPPKVTPDPQPWMRNPLKKWPHPQEPVILHFLVDPEHEETARAWMASL